MIGHEFNFILSASFILSSMDVSQGRNISQGVLFESTRSRSEGVQGLYLYRSLPLEEAAAIGYEAMFVTSLPVRFQIWRPIRKEPSNERFDQTMPNDYRLIGDKRVVPTQSMLMTISKVLLSPLEYVFTQHGDLFGVYNEGDGSALAYDYMRTFFTHISTYSITDPSLIVKNITRRMNSDYSRDVFSAEVLLDTNIYPYQLAKRRAEAQISTQPQLPVTSLAPVTSQSSGPGIWVPEGEVLLRLINRTEKILQTGADRTFIDPGLTFDTPGQIRSFWGQFVNDGQIQFQIWRLMTGVRQKRGTGEGERGDRRERATRLTYRLQAKFDHQVENDLLNPLPALREVRLGEDALLSVEAGDVVGFVNRQTTSVIGYTSLPVTLLHAPSTAHLSPGSMATFDTVSIPYSFALTASFIPDVIDSTDPTSESYSTTDPLAVGTTQPVVSTGSTETVTEVTTQPAPVVGASSQLTEDALAFVKSEVFLLILFLWLLLLSILLIILCLVFICCRSKVTQNQNGGSQPPASFINWSSRLRTDEDLDYYNPVGVNHNTNTVNSRPSASRPPSEHSVTLEKLEEPHRAQNNTNTHL